MTPEQRQARVMAGRLGGHAKWANTTDRTAATEAARRGLLDRFERQVDPKSELPPAVRAARAESARKAFYADLAIKSRNARARRKKSAA